MFFMSEDSTKECERPALVTPDELTTPATWKSAAG